MGIFQSSEAQQALKRATQIREEVLNRIQRKYEKLKPEMDQIAPQIKNVIKRASASQLSELMDNQKVTSLQIALTFIEPKNNYVIDEMFEQAVIRAKQCDRIRRQNPGKRCWRYGDNYDQTFPPFFGVVVSVKESILMKDHISYLGHVNVVNPVPSQQPLIIDLLLRMGFIPFTRTTVPPLCKAIETASNIFSYCKNGWDETRSCAGSSGGEGGIVGSGCSPFGIGTDIGGSSRIPAQWNGLCTIKPSFRYTTIGNAFFGKFATGIPVKSQICPIARSVQDIRIFCQFMFDPRNYQQLATEKRDIYLMQLPFNMQSHDTKPKLKIGYFYHIKDLYSCSPSHTRVVNQSVDILRRKGHEVKKIQMPELNQIYQLFYRMFISDPTLDSLNEIRKKQPPTKQFKLMYLITKIPWIIRVVLAWLLRKREPRMSKLITLSKPITSSVETVCEIHQNLKIAERNLYQYICNQQIDLWICPGFPVPALKHGDVSRLPHLISHTACWNAIQYPAGIVPVSVVRADELEYTDNINDSMTKLTKKNLKGSLGLPVGLQVVSCPNNDEQILYVMQQIQEEVHFRNNHSSSALNR